MLWATVSDDWIARLAPWSSLLATVVGVLLSLFTSMHVVLTKRQTRSAIAWVGLVWVAPYVGSLLYVLFGINRVHRRARSLRRDRPRIEAPSEHVCDDEALARVLGPEAEHLRPLARLVGEVTGLPLRAGNRIEPLIDGDAAYPAMLDAIEGTSRSLSMSTYIFYDDPVGWQFIDALGRAVARGVQVRVLIDDVGARYRWRTIVGPLRTAGVTVATFIPTMVPGWIPYINLRNHRKILVADGRLALTGGMNIDATFVHDGPTPADGRRRRVHHDLHFRVAGPVVADLQRVFVDDWAFTTNERLGGDTWFPPLESVGPTPARCVFDGPDEQLDPLLMTLLGAIAVARSSITIITPYFLPDEPLISALEVAALRGVAVDLLLPRASNLKLVEWATTPFLARVLEGGCRCWLTAPPFDHSKLMVVDGAWVFVGSANIDTRSLRLNFEVNLECYGAEVSRSVEPLIHAKMARAAPITLDDIRRRPFPIRLRDAVFRLASPYL
jgi:cardiolipin synthase